MSPRIPLPDEFRRSAFDRAAVRRSGLTQGRLRRKDVHSEFHGVWSAAAPESLLERCQHYAVRLKDGQFFSHGTAALLQGIPVPREFEEDAHLHVGAVQPADAPHAKQVSGHRMLVAPRIREVHGLPVADEAEVFCQLGAVLGVEDLVVVADHLLNITSLDEDAATDALIGRVGVVRRVGVSRLVRAARLARRGSGSPAETRIRLVLEAGGIPVPELNAKLFDAGGWYLGKPDFVWRAQRVVLEYEGPGHREDEQFRYDVLRYDVLRYEDLADAGWRVMRATRDDLTVAGRRRLVQRVAAALAA